MADDQTTPPSGRSGERIAAHLSSRNARDLAAAIEEDVNNVYVVMQLRKDQEEHLQSGLHGRGRRLVLMSDFLKLLELSQSKVNPSPPKKTTRTRKSSTSKKTSTTKRKRTTKKTEKAEAEKPKKTTKTTKPKTTKKTTKPKTTKKTTKPKE